MAPSAPCSATSAVPTDRDPMFEGVLPVADAGALLAALRRTTTGLAAAHRRHRFPVSRYPGGRGPATVPGRLPERGTAVHRVYAGLLRCLDARLLLRGKHRSRAAAGETGAAAGRPAVRRAHAAAPGRHHSGGLRAPRRSLPPRRRYRAPGRHRHHCAGTARGQAHHHRALRARSVRQCAAAASAWASA